MNTAILGVGAVGGLLAGRLLTAGSPVTLVDLPATTRRLRERGLRLIDADGTEHALATPDVLDAGERRPHDLVFVALKAQDLTAALPALTALLHSQTTLVTLQNGLPWWYFLRGSSAHAGRVLHSADPGGLLAATLGAERVLGCVPYPAAEMRSPGVVRHIEGNRFPVGELDGTRSARAQATAALLVGAGFKSPVLDNIRDEIWLKAWGNLSFNPVSALTGATMAGIGRLDETRQLVGSMMREAELVARSLGANFRVTLERRLQGAADVGEHKTSMLQDLEEGRSLEYEALVGSVLELARLQGIAAPTIETVYALIKLRDLSRHRASATNAQT